MPATTIDYRPARSWDKISIKVQLSQAEVVSSFLASLTGSGVESLSNPEGETIIGYLDHDQASFKKQNQLREFLTSNSIRDPEDRPIAIACETIIEEDWDSNWKEHFKPFAPTQRLVIKPSWEEYVTQANEVVVEMDPGMAFGTGLHASTQLALQLIEGLFPQPPAPDVPRTVLDVGTGTGILGLACALFGATQVIGLDNDIDARVAATENILRNHLEERMAIDAGELDQQVGPFDLVIANITSNVLTTLAPSLAQLTKAGGNLILAGILAGEQGTGIQKVYSELDFTPTAVEGKGEWVAFLFRKNYQVNG